MTLDSRMGVDSLAFRRALSRFATGVAVVTTDVEDGVAGITVNSFTSVSLAPPLVLWCLDEGASRYGAFASAAMWGVSILRADQESVSNQFARSATPLAERDGIARIAEDVPVLRRALAQLACRTLETHTLGDHLVIVGTVLAVNDAGGDALTYFASQYGRASAPGT